MTKELTEAEKMKLRDEKLIEDAIEALSCSSECYTASQCCKKECIKIITTLGSVKHPEALKILSFLATNQTLRSEVRMAAVENLILQGDIDRILFVAEKLNKENPHTSELQKMINKIMFQGARIARGSR